MKFYTLVAHSLSRKSTELTNLRYFYSCQFDIFFVKLIKNCLI